jgi:hypothetical protein
MLGYSECLGHSAFEKNNASHYLIVQNYANVGFAVFSEGKIKGADVLEILDKCSVPLVANRYSPKEPLIYSTVFHT